MGFEESLTILRTAPHLQAFFAVNDLMALGAIEAISALGMDGHIDVIGYDGIPEACRAIRQGLMTASVAQNPYEMGRIAVEIAYATIVGDDIVNEITVPIQLITQESIEFE